MKIIFLSIKLIGTLKILSHEIRVVNLLNNSSDKNYSNTFLIFPKIDKERLQIGNL